VSLIGSDKVAGTAVYGADDQKIGSVQRVMIDKVSGKVAYAVVSFGGFLSMGEGYYPLPWPNLKYDVSVGGYRVGIRHVFGRESDRLRTLALSQPPILHGSRLRMRRCVSWKVRNEALVLPA
jgi:hypothetical protein